MPPAVDARDNQLLLKAPLTIPSPCAKYEAFGYSARKLTRWSSSRHRLSPLCSPTPENSCDTRRNHQVHLILQEDRRMLDPQEVATKLPEFTSQDRQASTPRAQLLRRSSNILVSYTCGTPGSITETAKRKGYVPVGRERASRSRVRKRRDCLRGTGLTANHRFEKGLDAGNARKRLPSRLSGRRSLSSA